MERPCTLIIDRIAVFNLNFWDLSHVSIHEGRNLLSFQIKSLEVGQSYQFLRSDLQLVLVRLIL